MTLPTKDQLEYLKSVIGIIAVIAGGIWGVNEYLDKKHQDRVGKSYDFIEKFRADKSVRAYNEFAESAAVAEVLKSEALKSAEKPQRIKELHSPDQRAQLRHIVNLYSDAVVCAVADHCDKDALAAFLAAEAHQTLLIGREVIAEIRCEECDPEYAGELDTMRRWYCEIPELTAGQLKSATWCASPPVARRPVSLPNCPRCPATGNTKNSAPYPRLGGRAAG